MDIFSQHEDSKPTSIGKTVVEYKSATAILTEGKGFMDAYDYTLNPYSGCSFGCTYCYAAFFAKTPSKQDTWGYWLDVKQNALQLLMKYRNKSLRGKSIYMSTVTDPYQPIEHGLKLTRSLIKELLIYHQPRLVIQTRSPLVTRDIDLLKQYRDIQINMTVTTDSEKVRKVFEPFCPSNIARLKGIEEIQKAGLNACITITPLLPVENAQDFVKRLLATGVKKFIIQPFHADKGNFVASTREGAINLIKEMNWTFDEHQRVVQAMQQYIPDIGIGKTGFAPK